MTDEYTPTVEEVKADYLNWQTIFVADEDDTEANYEALMRWNRMIVAVERAAAAKALREAAVDYRMNSQDRGEEVMPVSEWKFATTPDWLDIRADRIESGERE